MLGRIYLISCCFSWFVFPLFDISKMLCVVPLDFSWPRLSVGLRLLLVLMSCLSGPGCLSRPACRNGVTKPRCCGAVGQCCPPGCSCSSPEHREARAVWEHASPAWYVAKGWKSMSSDCGEWKRLEREPKASLPEFPQFSGVSSLEQGSPLGVPMSSCPPIPSWPDTYRYKSPLVVNLYLHYEIATVSSTQMDRCD